MKQLTQQQTALVPYQGAIQRVDEDTPLRVLFYSNLVQDWQDAHPGWFEQDDSFGDPYEALRTADAYAARRAIWGAESRRLEAEAWRRLGPGPKGWRIANGRYVIGNLEPVQVLRPARKRLKVR